MGLAAILTYYKGGVRADGVAYSPNDLPEIISFMQELWAAGDIRKLAEKVLAADWIWHENLNEIPQLTDRLVYYLQAIRQDGMLSVVTAQMKASDDSLE